MGDGVKPGYLLASSTVLFLALSGIAQAQTALDTLVQQLQSEGYREISVKRTWLGRLRIEAKKKGAEREIVLNPSTGVILRDYRDHDETSDDHEDGNSRAGEGLQVATDDEHQEEDGDVHEDKKDETDSVDSPDEDNNSEDTEEEDEEDEADDD